MYTTVKILWCKRCIHCVIHNLAIDNWQWQMQAGVTNPLSETFRIYNPNKNIEKRDADLKFICYWIPELRGYSLSEILAGAYIGESPYPHPVLDWSQTRKVNGKIISNLRKQVKQRLLAEQGEDYEQAVIAKKTVDKYWEVKNQQYQECKHLSKQTARSRTTNSPC